LKQHGLDIYKTCLLVEQSNLENNFNYLSIWLSET